MNEELTIDLKILFEIAKKASAQAYAPYSGYKVGAAIQTKKGKTFTGCNIENSSYGATICAERTAIF
ncbi:MAG: cytidine deaminase, partial [Candidatus Cloacimonetes bacterium]|nr:cytidine deaminase [Candidatus Cloacimonadota bacterium]